MQFNPIKLMVELNAKANENWTHAGQTYDSIGWIGDPVFTEEQFNIKKEDLLKSDPIPDPE